MAKLEMKVKKEPSIPAHYIITALVKPREECVSDNVRGISFAPDMARACGHRLKFVSYDGPNIYSLEGDTIIDTGESIRWTWSIMWLTDVRMELIPEYIPSADEDEEE